MESTSPPLFAMPCVLSIAWLPANDIVSPPHEYAVAIKTLRESIQDKSRPIPRQFLEVIKLGHFIQKFEQLCFLRKIRRLNKEIVSLSNDTILASICPANNVHRLL